MNHTFTDVPSNQFCMFLNPGVAACAKKDELFRVDIKQKSFNFPIVPSEMLETLFDKKKVLCFKQPDSEPDSVTYCGTRYGLRQNFVEAKQGIEKLKEKYDPYDLFQD